ncbi:pseudouridine synthase [Volvox carteri f. nagariensis]|uniref:Pseudouridine synthase n=1 Tax=Volvox carteri f. nagariensis TaxID=3068 RepID=D8TTJ5_VOLCA|nr:pseudouridine synthase [Volvox carteri f. nagariensis]EFJ49320.1 pseudouridine synthase [Volvox carteri f. nagariensis]|eukprot:XP_002949768.1 pseudouridine synthase [Volvox carteri f. nagariensis]
MADVPTSQGLEMGDQATRPLPAEPIDLELPPMSASVAVLAPAAGVSMASAHDNAESGGVVSCPPGEHQQEQEGRGPTQSSPGTILREGKQRQHHQQEQRQQQRQHHQDPQQQGFLPSELPPDTTIEDASTAPRPGDYVFVDGLRLVKPYYFDFKCFVKKRQDGKPLMQLMAEEFPMLSPEYYREAVASGRLRMEPSSCCPGRGGAEGGKGKGRGGGGIWTPERPLRAGMCIRHFIHRHEPPVLAGEVQILGITDDFVAVNKPACLPVHTVGQYRKNTVMGVMQAMYPRLWPLYPTYRLDKPVSGVLLLARSSAVAARMRVLLEERGCSKAYVARVQGVFPDTDAAGGPLVVDVPLGWEAKTNHATPVPREAVEAAAAGGPLPPGLNPELAASAKPAETHFRRLSVAPDGLTSVVEAVPKTGRTHQIRVHLQHLGHPIANDTQYGGLYGLPLFFRRGMGGPARPHVNGQRRRLAEAGTEGEAAALVAAAEGCEVVTAPGSRSNDSPVAAGVAGCGEQLVPASSASSPKNHASKCAGTGTMSASALAPVPHKRQRRCDDGQRSSGGSDGGGSCMTGSCSAAAAAEAEAEAEGEADAMAAGPNGRAELVAASSERYVQLYTLPQFQVPGGSADPLCPHCPCLVPEGYPIDLEPLYLHAARYAGPSSTNGCEAARARAAGSKVQDHRTPVRLADGLHTFRVPKGTTRLGIMNPWGN